MAKLSLALAALVASASAFAPQTTGPATSALSAGSGRVLPFVFNKEQAQDETMWDPMGLYELGSGEDFDTFPNMFPSKQYLEESEIKHGRQAMLAWTGIWATHKVSIIRFLPQACSLSSTSYSLVCTLSDKREDSDLDYTFLVCLKRTGLLLSRYLQRSSQLSLEPFSRLSLLQRARVLVGLVTTSVVREPRRPVIPIMIHLVCRRSSPIRGTNV